MRIKFLTGCARQGMSPVEPGQIVDWPSDAEALRYIATGQAEAVDIETTTLAHEAREKRGK